MHGAAKLGRAFFKKHLFFTILGIIVIAPVMGLQPAKTLASRVEVALLWDVPPNYRIVYLVADGAVPADSPISPSEMAATLRAQTVSSWDDVVLLDNAVPIDALVIHDSALSGAYNSWLESAYRRGVVIGVFNTYASQAAALLGDPCIAKDNFASEPYPGQFFLVVSYLVLGQPEDGLLIEEDTSCGEKQVVGIQGQISATFGRSADNLSDISDRNAFARVLVSHIEGIKRTKLDFQNRADLGPNSAIP